MKKPCNILKITKNKINTDLEGMFTYLFEWYNNEELMIRELYKIQSDDYGLPIENYNINEMIQHKQYCCLEIDLNTLKIKEL